MKAKHHIARFNNDPTDANLIAIAQEFDADTEALLKTRNVQTPEGFRSVLHEMDNKWRAFSNGCAGKVNPSGYGIVMHAIYPAQSQVAWPDQKWD